MAVDRNKKRLVFLTHDQMVNLAHLAKMHLDENGAPKILQAYPVSEEYAKSLREVIKVLDENLKEIWDAEEDGK